MRARALDRIVRMEQQMAASEILVGVDGSPESAEALRWAADQAKLMGAKLHVVHAWAPPTVAALGLPPGLDWSSLRDSAARFAHEFVGDTLGDDPGIPIRAETIRGTPAQVLVDASNQADLLVIGSRGLGGLKGMLLGSVGHHCAAHAHCPVVIFRPHVSEPRRPTKRESPRPR
jgi:nucleotide-binding universal stress UspA family protein